MIMEQETWKYIEGYGDYYEISSYGKIRCNYKSVNSIKGRIAIKRDIPKLIKSFPNEKGYLCCRIGFLEMNHIKKTVRIHRITAKHFLSTFDESLEVNHEDGDKLNNHYKNFSMVTRQQNMAHAWNTGLVNIAYGENQSKTKLKEEQVLEIFNSKEQTMDLALKYNVGRRQIWMIRSGRNWSHLTGDKK